MELSPTSKEIISPEKHQKISLNGKNAIIANGHSYNIKSDFTPRTSGKFIFLGSEKFYVKGVSYGAFKPDENKNEYTDINKLDIDFQLMAKNGINTVRIPHTMPPRHLLDVAHRHGLKVMVGLSAEQYVGYLIDKKKSPNFKKLIGDKLKECKNHPALLCIAIGNEIPSSLVRWIGHKKIEKYLKKIYNIIKQEIPDAIVTYVNYPTTEYLQLSFLDLLCFNVYLENQEDFEKYLYRLQNIAANRPLLMGEIGLDSQRNGTDVQAQTLSWQIQSTFKTGCAGLFIFSWTDEWYRGEEEVYDWAFGLTTRNREPKPALEQVSMAFKNGPFYHQDLPMFSVIVCSFNGAKTLHECFRALQKLNYSNYEVIFINDGSTDNSLEIASKFDVEIISTENNGLSHARNLGLHIAKGEIVVYLDDDAYPDPDWLMYLGMDFNNTDFAAIGGPNISPENIEIIPESINNAPGSPTHVLHSDRIAEHIPGCNMAFRKDALLNINGFDPQFRVAGDDVDVCWKLQAQGKIIGFSPAAFVWHHRRGTIKAYWKQQYGYGKAEALLEKKWPEKYNNFGHRSWNGRIYGDGMNYLSALNKSRIYSGIWGSAPFQSIYDLGKKSVFSITLMPEWYMVCLILLSLSIVGLVWKPLLVLIPAFFGLSLIPIGFVIPSVLNLNPKSIRKKGWWAKKKFQFITIFLYLIQPLARLSGRLKNHLTPWRRFSGSFLSFKIFGKSSVWCEHWLSPGLRLEYLEKDLQSINPYVYRGGDFDKWDLCVKGGAFAGIRIQMAAEDHAKGTQYLRFRIKPVISSLSKYLLLFSVLTLIISVLDNSKNAMIVVLGIILLFILRILWDSTSAAGCYKKAIQKQTDLSE